MNFICPKCKGALTVTDGGVAKCPLGHSYDRAKEGYYNLLLSSAGGVHGDNREMVQARRAFLDTGAYLPLARRVAELASEHTPDGGLLLDCGCGEGFYTHTINKIANNVNKTLYIEILPKEWGVFQISCGFFSFYAFSVSSFVIITPSFIFRQNCLTLQL